ncbi:MAG: nuclease-related domain-containing protein [Solirubrobacteraceae bacterium]
MSRAALWVDLGILVGALISGLIALLDSPPHRIESWRSGYEGERKTARALAKLRRSGCVVLHDLPDRRATDRCLGGNIDHVVVSRGGVFVLDSKWLGGDVSIDGDVVRVQPPDDPDDCWEWPRLARKVRGIAVRLQEDISQETGVRFVQPLIVFWSRFEAGLVNGNNIVFIDGERLADWLAEQPASQSAEWVQRVATSVEAARPREREPGRLSRRSRRPALTAPQAHI